MNLGTMWPPSLPDTVPHTPKELLVFLRNAHGIAEWKLFLNE